MTEARVLSTPHGDARLLADRSRRPVVTLLLGHGAGGGPESDDLAALARELPRTGVTVLRLEQPWRVAGRRVAARPEVLDACLVSVADRLRPRTPLVLGGRSAGARSAARTAHHLGASGVLALAFPLHPPGRPERSRLEELASVRVPALVIQGEADPFGRPEEFPAGIDLVVVPDADHSFKVPRRAPLSRSEVLALVVAEAGRFVLGLAAERPGNRTRSTRVHTG